MYCTNCGRELSDGSRFCPACGTQIPHADVAADNNVEQTQKTGRTRGIVIGVAATCIVIGLGLTAMLLFLSGKTGTKEQIPDSQIAAQEEDPAKGTVTEIEKEQEMGKAEDTSGEKETAPAENADDLSGAGAAESADANREGDDSKEDATAISGPVREGFEVYADTREDYNKCLNPDKYYKYESDIPGFTFYYPNDLFHNVTESDISYIRELDTKTGNGREVTFFGDAGTQLQYKVLFYTMENDIEKESELLHKKLLAYLHDTQDIAYTVKDDSVRFVVNGICEGQGEANAYALVRVTQDCVMEYVFIVNGYADEADHLRKNYVTECLYRMCGFSGSKSSPRSWEEFLVETSSSKMEYSDDQICQMCLDHYERANGYRPGDTMIASKTEDELVIQLFDDMGDHTATSDWYTIDRKTGKGTNFLGESISLW